LLIERDEFCLLGQGAHHHFVAGDVCRIERVEGMSRLVKHEVGDVHHVVDGTQADGRQVIL
jgi:hypothetical protein